MTGPDFLALAARLVAESTEADWRTAASRAYYAAFHVGRRWLEDVGFRVPQSDRAHAYLWLRFSNCGDRGAQAAAVDLQRLRSDRNHADYDLHRPLDQRFAAGSMQTARQIIRALDAAMRGPAASQITAAIRVYERDVLHDVTWQGP